MGKRERTTVRETNSPDFRRGVTKIAQDLQKMERTSVEDDTTRVIAY